MYNNEILKIFKNLKIKLEKDNIKLSLCKIYGRRWSFLCGENSILVPFYKKIKISKDYGIVIFCNDNIKFEKYVKFIKDFFNDEFSKNIKNFRT